MKISHLLLIFFTSLPFLLIGQIHNNYIGAGHSKGIKVTCSSSVSKSGWQPIADGIKTIDGSGLDWEKQDAIRFLSHATLCHTADEVDSVLVKGHSKWIDDQMSMPYTSYLNTIKEIHQEWINFDTSKYSLFTLAEPHSFEIKTAWWRTNMTQHNLLREKISLALSEFLVISGNAVYGPYGYGICDYFDILKKHAFGNYRDILFDISMHPNMGVYLSHLGNKKEDKVLNTFPDQNYARELMQLFSIGLVMLNNDGSNKLDSMLNPIPTYNNLDIEALARVFTGLGPSAAKFPTFEGLFDMPIYAIDFTKPMKMFEEHHDIDAKTLINGHVIPANQNGIKDIKDAIDVLFMHPNVGPFVSRRLIQHLVTSNPSPQYIERISTVFNDDGNQVRGNMAAVIKAILLDIEARNCDQINNKNHGRLRNPSERMLYMIRNLGFKVNSNKIFDDEEYLWWATRHMPWYAPSVFNFHEPDFKPSGEMSKSNLVGPEFQLFNESTSVEYGNVIFRLFYIWKQFGRNGITFKNNIADENYKIQVNLDLLLDVADDPEALLNHLDLRFCYGRLTEHTRSVIKKLLLAINHDTNFNDPFVLYDGSEASLRLERVSQAVSLIMLCPEYNIIK